MSSRRILYWALQTFGWGSYFAYFTGLVALYAHNRPLLHAIPALALLHVAASHAIRWVIRSRHWLELPIGRLLLQSLGLCALLAVAVQLAATPVVVACGAATLPVELRNMWGYALYSFLLFVLWTAFYLGFEHAFLYRESEVQRLRLEASLRDAELRALKAQVNPHFMFNCLNNLRSLVSEDSERAREMLLRLSELLRYALEIGRNECVPLSQEMRVVSAYLDLEKLQFEERLTWNFDVEESAAKAEIPPMLLQQLVENAIKHGIAKNPSGGGNSSKCAD